MDWLIILGPQLTAKLGGAEALKSALDERFSVDHLPSGSVFIRAGKSPQTGGEQSDPRPRLYTDLNRVLKPVRVNKLIDGFQIGHYTQPFFDLPASQKWIERLDDPS